MATKTTCDGCGVEIPSDTLPTGHWGHQYCDDDRVLAAEYLEKLGDLHTEVSRIMSDRLEQLRAKYRPHLQQLPDQ